MLIAYTKDQLLAELEDLIRSGESSRQSAVRSIIARIEAGTYDPALWPDGDASPRFESNASFQPARIEPPPSITIPPGYEVVIRKAER